jgi:hypothetical protein
MVSAHKIISSLNAAAHAAEASKFAFARVRDAELLAWLVEYFGLNSAVQSAEA